MKAAVISLESKSSLMIIEAMKRYFDEVDDIDLRGIEINLSGKDAEILYKDKKLSHYDCVFLKGSFRYSGILSGIATILEGKTYLPLKSSSFTLAHDKLLSHFSFQAKGLPMPRTYLAATPEAAKMIFKKIHFPIVMKFPKGTQGKGVVFADSFSSASSILDALMLLNQPFLIQEFIDTEGEDVRAIVVGDKVVASMKRFARSDEKRSNIHAGGRGESFSIDAYTEKIAVQAAKSINAEVCGVDILMSVKGPLVLEVNVSPGLQGITEVCKRDVADDIAKYIFKRAKSIKDAENRKNAKAVIADAGIIKAPTIMSNLTFRGVRILLPEFCTALSKINDSDMCEINASKGKIVLKKIKDESNE